MGSANSLEKSENGTLKNSADNLKQHGNSRTTLNLELDSKRTTKGSDPVTSNGRKITDLKVNALGANTLSSLGKK